MTEIPAPQPPRGWKAKLWRAPIWFYRLGLGRLFGDRFLLLTHTGRKSGLDRQAVIEVVDRDPQAEVYYVVSGFGERAQWFKNILKTPRVRIHIGGREMPARAERLPVEEGERILSGYARKHPAAMRELTRLLKIPYDGSRKSIHKMATMMPVVAFHAKTTSMHDIAGQRNER
jgi:deazaflavin-dependent oxidoreductase (nitroreductase family)